MKFKKLVSELARRNVFRAVVAYLAVAWVIIQIASTILPVFDASPFFLKGLIYLLGVGLVFWTAFAWLYDLTPEGIKRTKDFHTDPEIRDSNSRRLNRIIVGAIVCAILLLIGASFWAGSQWATPGLSKNPVKMAVLPLETVTESEESAVWEEGFTEALIEELSTTTDMLVLSMASTRQMEAAIGPKSSFWSKQTDQVDFFLEGRLQKTANNLEIQFFLKKRLDEEPIWQNSYAADLSQIRGLWSEVTTDVREIIGPKVLITRARWKELKPVRPEVYELYLKGKYYLNRSTVADWQRGLVYLQEAIDRNPADPDAYAGLAEGYITWGHSLTPPPDVFQKAEAAAKRAIQLDSNNAAGWAALSQYNTYFGWDWELADYAFRRADALNPNLAMNHYHRAWYLALFGRMDAAIEEHKKAQAIDPFSSLHTGWLGGLYNMVNDYDMALAEARKSAQTRDDDALSKVVAGRAYIGMGKVNQGIDTLRRAAEINSGWKYLVLAPALVANGYREEGVEIARELESFEPTPFYSLCLAQIYYSDANWDAALRWAKQARGHAYYPWAIRIFFTDPELVADPRYQELIKELNLPAPAPLKYQGKEIPLRNISAY